MFNTLLPLLASASSPNPMSNLDIILFLVFVIGVVALGIYQGEKSTSDNQESGGAAGYFLAGRGLTWWLVGFSLIAANISTEQFVGMSGLRRIGLEWPSPRMNGWPPSLW
jgi:Na+/pantothenate symporter